MTLSSPNSRARRSSASPPRTSWPERPDPPGPPIADRAGRPPGSVHFLQGAISAELRAAFRSLDVALFHVTSDRHVQALAERRRAGVAVKVLLDRAQSDGDFVRQVSPRGEEARFHQKYAVLDARLVVTGSYKWTLMGDVANHENAVVRRQEPAARLFRENFEKTWQDKELSQP